MLQKKRGGAGFVVITKINADHVTPTSGRSPLHFQTCSAVIGCCAVCRKQHSLHRGEESSIVLTLQGGWGELNLQTSLEAVLKAIMS